MSTLPASTQTQDRVPHGLTWSLKRAIDVTGSLTALALLLPVFIAIALAVVLETGWPPLFTQLRVGRGGHRFTLYKFRTMVQGAETTGAGLFFAKNDKRFTRVGTFLRRYSLDELPQLWNVFTGDLSFVGPRPMVPLMADKLVGHQQKRHGVRPGITGWAQTNGRNEILWSRRILLDNWYVDNWSLALDVRILLRTIPLVVAARDVRLDQDPGDVDDLARG